MILSDSNTDLIATRNLDLNSRILNGGRKKKEETQGNL